MKKAAIIILALWSLLTLTFIITNEYTINTGKEVLLRTIPVDPRDIIMGDYVILNYEIAQTNTILKNEYLPYNKEIYVTLDVDNDNVANIKWYSFNRPQNSLYLKGKLKGCNTIIPFIKSGKCISYGIENYYVKENTGHEIEKDLRNGALVKVKIDKNGNAKIIGFVN